MEIIAPKLVLKNAITLARKALSSLVVQEERGHLLFIVSGSQLIIKGTNNDLKAQCIVEIQNKTGEEFSFTANPKIFEKLISKAEVNDIHLLFDPSTCIIKIYTTENKRSYGTLQSFTKESMITFDFIKTSGYQEYEVKKDMLLFALKYASYFLTGKKEEQKHFDFVIINRGIVYAANGSNKLGLIVSQLFSKIPEIKIRKMVLPLFSSFAKGINEDIIKIIQTDKDIGVISSDGKYYFSFLKSTIETSEIPRHYLKSEGPYTLVDKNRLIKIADRVIITNNSTTIVGLNLKLSGSGDQSLLEIKLVSNREAIETMECKRVNDGKKIFEHIVDYRMLIPILNAFDTKEDVRIHINDNGKAFKIYSKGEIEKEKYILVGVGTYAKIERQQYG